MSNYEYDNKANIQEDEIYVHNKQESSDIETNFIRGEIKYYNTKDVASELGESESTIRFWCENLKESMDILRSGRNRKFTRENIEQLKFVQDLLRNKEYSVEQVKEFLSKSDTEIVNSARGSEPLTIQALASALMGEMEIRFNNMLEADREKRQQDMVAFAEEMALSQQKLLENTTIKVDEIISEKVSCIEKSITDLSDIDKANEIQKEIAELKLVLKKQSEKQDQDRKEYEKKVEERDLKLTELLKQSLENKEDQSKKGFFSRIFGK